MKCDNLDSDTWFTESASDRQRAVAANGKQQRLFKVDW